MKPIAIGTQDFKELIENNCLFIDKTLFIKELIDDQSKVLLFPRPRRFGKSLNMSMINYYFNMEYNSKCLFKDLNISKCDHKYLNEMNKYPVLSLSLKDCKKSSFLEFKEAFKKTISILYSKYLYILDSPLILDFDKEYFKRCLNGTEEIRLADSLATLIELLRIYYNKQVIVLLDEYDAPIMEGYLNNYYNDIIIFIRDMFQSTFKDNLNLKKGIITGILRVSKESMFSGANNINVYNITDSNFSTYFGFLEDEIIDVLNKYNLSHQFNKVKKWYDGYLFNKHTIYNPWSILKFLHDKDHTFQVYWANTGGVDLLKNLIYTTKGDITLLDKYHSLLDNGYIEHINLDYYMDLNYLETDLNTIITLFMLSGYLTPTKHLSSLEDVTLKIPNLEIRKNLEDICINWFKNTIKYRNAFEDYLVTNNMYDFKINFQKIVLESFSYYDVNIKHGENFYHAFVMGLLYSGSVNFDIKSNHESGYGRYDLILKPKNNSSKYAYIIEFKAIEENNFKNTIEKAFKQIDEKKYQEEIKEFDVTKIVIVFKGKEIRIETRK